MVRPARSGADSFRMRQPAVICRREGEADPCAGDETGKDGRVDERDRRLVRPRERIYGRNGGAPARRVERGCRWRDEGMRREWRESEEVDRSEEENDEARDGRNEVRPAVDCRSRP